jgi:hypothetical protein
LGAPTRTALQPGEELVKAGARRGVLGQRAARVTPGVNADAIDFDSGPFSGESRGQLDLTGRSRGDTTPEVDTDNLPTDIGGTRPDFGDSGGSPLNRGGFNQRLDTDTGSDISQQFRSDLESDSGLPSVDSPQVDFRTQFDDPVATDGTVVVGGVGTTSGVAGVGIEQQQRERSPTRERLLGGALGLDGQQNTQRLFDDGETGVGSDQRLDPNTGSQTETGIIPLTTIRADARTDSRLNTDIAQDQRTETELVQETETARETETEINLGVESETAFEIEPEAPPQENNDDEEDPLFGVLGDDKRFDSGILSGREALSSAFDSR